MYDIRPGNGAGPFLQPRSPHGALVPVLQAQQVAGSNPGRIAFGCNPVEIATHIYASVTKQYKLVTAKSWKVIVCTGVAVAMRHRQWYFDHLRVQRPPLPMSLREHGTFTFTYHMVVTSAALAAVKMKQTDGHFKTFHKTSETFCLQGNNLVIAGTVKFINQSWCDDQDTTKFTSRPIAIRPSLLPRHTKNCRNPQDSFEARVDTLHHCRQAIKATRFCRTSPSRLETFCLQGYYT